MNYKELQKLLSKSNTLAVVLAAIVASLGLLILIFPFLWYKGVTSLVLSLIFGLLLLIMGLVASRRLLSDQIKARRGMHPILKAIKEKDRDLLVWVYIQQINTTLGHDGLQVGATQNINYFTKDCKGKGKTIIVGKRYDANEIIEYLKTEFDIPYLDYSDQTRATMNEYYGTSGIKKL